MYASLTDVQAWLTEDKLPADDANVEKPMVQAQRLIRAQLVGTFTSATMLDWTTPDDTPELIRTICGELTAAFLYRALYSAEGLQVPPYAQLLYSEALASLTQIKEGQITVIDGDGNTVGDTGGILSFFPDNTSPPKFTSDELPLA